MRNHKNEKWQMLQSAAYANENELQKLLAEQPSLISLNEVRENTGLLVAAVQEFPLGIGSVDLVGFTAEGSIVIVECKLASNVEIKRKVIGQVLEYGANLWGMSYQELDEKILLRSKKSLVNLVKESVQEQDWVEESFRTNIDEALKNGDFVLIIVVDEINDELARIIRFINEAGRPSFSLAALEMRRFHKDQTEILVPHVFGSVNIGKQAPGASRKQWTKERFFEVANASLPKDVVAIISDLYEWSLSKAKRVWFGTGTASGSFTFHYMVNGKTVSVFSVYTNGIITLNYGWLVTQVDLTTIQKFHQSITSIPGFENIAADFTKWPNIHISTIFLQKPEPLASFKNSVGELGKNLLSLL